MSQERKLFPVDQARGDEYLRTGYNDVERKPFRPLRLLFLLLGVVTGFSALSVAIAHFAGIY
jgi:hypothetical protein